MLVLRLASTAVSISRVGSAKLDTITKEFPHKTLILFVCV